MAARTFPVDFAVGAESAIEEPPCSCMQTDVYLFDARGCELHDENSAWNVAQRAETDGERYWTAVGDEECPF